MSIRYYTAGGGPTSGLTQPQVDARIAALAEPSIRSYGSIAAADAAHALPVPPGEAYVAVLANGNIIRAAENDNTFTEVAGATLPTGTVVDVTPGVIPTNLGDLALAVDPSGQPAGQVWQSLYGPAPHQVAQVVGGVWAEVSPTTAATPNNWVHADATTVAATVTASPTLAEMQAFVTAQAVVDAPLYYTGNDNAGDPASLSYWVDGAGTVLPSGAASSAASPIYTATDITTSTTAGVLAPGIYDPFQLRSWYYTEGHSVGVVYRHDPTYAAYNQGRIVIGTNGQLYEALVNNPTETPTDVGQTEWKPVDLVPTPTVPAEAGYQLRVRSDGEYELFDPSTAPTVWQPDTPYDEFVRITAVDPADPPNRRLYEVPAGGLTSGSTPPGFDTTEAARYTDLGPSDPGDMVGATAGADGVKGAAPQPLAGDERKVLTGGAAYEFREAPAIRVATFAAAQAHAETFVGSSQVYWVENGGPAASKRKGAFRRILPVDPANPTKDPSATSTAWSNWYGTIDTTGFTNSSDLMNSSDFINVSA